MGLNTAAEIVQNITDTTPSTSPTTGALTVAGGVGIGGALNVGGAETAASLALGGATIGTNALAVTGAANISGQISTSSNLVASGVLQVGAAGTMAFNGRGIFTSTNVGVIQHGDADAAAPVAQTLQVQSVVAGTTDTAGADWSFHGSKGTGTGAGGALKFYTSPTGTTGTAVNAGVLRLSLDSTGALTGSTANGATWTNGHATELLTLSTGGTTTDTTANLLPANSVIESVVARVTTSITTATDWELGDATTPGRFAAPNATMTAGATSIGLVHIDQTAAAGPRQTAAAKVRVTTTGTPAAGAIRITVFYRTFVAPTS